MRKDNDIIIRFFRENNIPSNGIFRLETHCSFNFRIHYSIRTLSKLLAVLFFRRLQIMLRLSFNLTFVSITDQNVEIEREPNRKFISLPIEMISIDR